MKWSWYQAKQICINTARQRWLPHKVSSQNTPQVTHTCTHRHAKYIHSTAFVPHIRTMCIKRSLPWRLNTLSSLSSRTKITSPGSMPGSWSPSPANTIFCPSFIPGSTWTWHRDRARHNSVGALHDITNFTRIAWPKGAFSPSPSLEEMYTCSTVTYSTMCHCQQPENV